MFDKWVTSNFAVGTIDSASAHCVVIDAEKVIFREKEVVITIDLAEDVLRQIGSIEINGFKFVKES